MANSREEILEQVKGALSDAVAVHREAEPFGGEVLRDLDEPAALLTHQVGRRNSHVDVGQLAGVAAEPAHLRKAAYDGQIVRTVTIQRPDFAAGLLIA